MLSLLPVLAAKYHTEAELSDCDFSPLSLGLLSSQLTKVHMKQTWIKKKVAENFAEQLKAVVLFLILTF